MSSDGTTTPLSELADQLRRMARDGSVGRLEVHDADDEVRELADLIHQVIERVRSEHTPAHEEVEVLRRQADLLHGIMHHVPHTIFWKNREGEFTGGNHNFVQALGQESIEQVIGRTDLDFFPTDQAQFFRACDAEVMRSGVPLLDIEEPQDQPDGTHTLLTSKVPLRDAGGEVVGLLGIYVDITARKRMEEELRQTRDAAEAADRAKSTFLSTVSHELRTPLTLMLGPLDWILAHHDRDLPQDVRADLACIRRHGGRLLDLVNDLLEFTIAEADALSLAWEPVDVAAEVRGLVDDVAPPAEAAGLALDTGVDDAVGTVALDRRRFERIVFNLVGNAIKFTPRGGRVCVTLRALGDELELAVSDTGPGVPEDKQELIFRRFEQLDAGTTRQHEGAGIGLALVQELVRRMGGEVGVESRPGEGARFWVRLPRRPMAPADAPQAEPVEPVEPAPVSAGEPGERGLAAPHLTPRASQGPRPRVLVVDDNDDMRAYVARVLSEQYDVEQASGGAEALEAARRRPPVAVVSDVMMPDVDGLDLVRQLKSDPELQHVPVLLLTARASRQDIVAGLETGADDYLPKPFGPDELRARVRAAERMHGVYAELERKHRELSEAHEHLEHVQDALVQSAKIAALGTLVAGLAHEMNNPLSVILMNAQVALRRSQDPDVRETFATIELHARRCAELVRSLFEVARMKPRALEPVAIGDIVSRASLLAEPRARSIGATLHTSTAIPPGLQVRGSAQALETAVLNLLSNALHASSGGGTVEVELSERERHGRPGVAVRIVDEGPGIPSDVLPRVFDPFFTTRLEGQGTGLGLSVTRSIIERHDGHVDLQTGPDGTTASLWLPTLTRDPSPGPQETR